MKPLPILYLEDSAQDVELVEATLAAEGLACTVHWVETAARFRQALAQMAQPRLEHLGYEAVVTTSSHEALDTFRRRPGHFDVVVTDQTMPGLTGDQLARELLALRPELPIILCTGFSPTLTEEKAWTLGVTYLRKPFSTADLGRALEDIFTSREES